MTSEWYSLSPNHRSLFHAKHRLKFDPKPIVEAYLSGESELSISKRTNLQRIVIRRRLLEAGIAIRSISEANRLRMSRLSFEERRALTHASHKGAKNITSEKRKKMLEQAALAKCKKIGHGELEMIEALKKAGLPVEPQKPVGPYNIDIAVGTVAVELTSLPWERKAKTRFPVRFKYLAEHGYTLMTIQFKSRESVVNQLDDLVALVNQTYRLPTVYRKHRMIRCGSNHFSIVRDNKGQFSAVPTPETFFYSCHEINP